jgi:archaellum component FlaG (FlaF/FlaG flagellin family)
MEFLTFLQVFFRLFIAAVIVAVAGVLTLTTLIITAAWRASGKPEARSKLDVRG